MPTPRLLTVNLSSTLAPVRLVHNAIEYLVAPCVLVVAGVLNGGLLPDTAIVPGDWAGVPVVCGHPLDAAGAAISASTPGVPHLGTVRRPRLGSAQRSGLACASLVAELWLDVAQAAGLGGPAAQALAMVDAQTPLEVSTAFYPVATAQLGSWHGVAYHEVYSAVTPDHLALLPNGVGACNWEHGCGSPRLNHQTTPGAACPCSTCTPEGAAMDTPPTGWRGFVAMLRDFVQREIPAAALVTEQTDTDVREALYSVIAREQGRSVSDVFLSDIDRLTQTFVYRQGERLLQRHWTLDAAGVLALDPDVVEVQRSTSFLPVGTPGPVPRPATFTEETQPMPASAAVVALATALITNALTPWDEADRPQLEAMSETQLAHLTPAPPLVTHETREPETLEATVARFPVLARLVRQEQARKGAVIALLVANKSCPFTPEKLASLALEELEGLVALASGGTSYIGQGLPHERPVLPKGPPEPPDTLAAVVVLQKANGMRS